MRYTDLEQQAIDEAIRKLLNTPRYRMVWRRVLLSAALAGMAGWVTWDLPREVLRLIAGSLVGCLVAMLLPPWTAE